MAHHFDNHSVFLGILLVTLFFWSVDRYHGSQTILDLLDHSKAVKRVRGIARSHQYDQTPLPMENIDLETLRKMVSSFPHTSGCEDNASDAGQLPRTVTWCPCTDDQIDLLRKSRMPKKEDTWRSRRENQLLFESNKLPKEPLPERDEFTGRQCPCSSDGDDAISTPWVDPCVRLGLVSPKDEPNLSDPLHANMLDICDPLAAHDPGSPPEGTPTRVAHCLTGSVRFPGYLQVPFLYNQTVINTLGAPSDIFIVLDATDGKLDELERGKTREKTKLLFGATKVEFLSAEMWTSEVPAWVKTSFFNRFHNVAQFFKKDMCYRMIRMHEARHNIRYTHIINGRPDLILPLGYGPIKQYSLDAIATAQYGEERDINVPDTPPWTVVLPGPKYLRERHHGWNEVVTDITQVIPAKFAHRFFRQTLSLMVRDVEAPGEDVTGDRIQFLMYRENGLEEVVNRHSITYKMFRHSDRCNDPDAFKWNDWCI